MDYQVSNVKKHNIVTIIQSYLMDRVKIRWITRFPRFENNCLLSDFFFISTKNTKNNYDNFFIVEGELKLLSCFHLNIDLNDISSYCMKYLLRRCRKKQCDLVRLSEDAHFSCTISWNCTKLNFLMTNHSLRS